MVGLGLGMGHGKLEDQSALNTLCSPLPLSWNKGPMATAQVSMFMSMPCHGAKGGKGPELRAQERSSLVTPHHVA